MYKASFCFFKQNILNVKSDEDISSARSNTSYICGKKYYIEPKYS